MANLANRAFSAGELAPALYARTDVARYEVGLRACRNYMVMRQGGATKRPGTEFITEIADSTTKARLVPFVFNVSDSLVLEFGHLYIRFIQNGGVVLDPIDDSLRYEIASPYTESDVPGLQMVQSADVVTIVHPLHPPYELRRLSNVDWTLNAIVFGPVLGQPTLTNVTLGDPSITRDTTYVITRVSAAGEESIASNAVTVANPPTVSSPTFIEAVIAGATTFNVYRQDIPTGVYGFIGAGIGDVVQYFDFGAIPDITLQPPIAHTLFASDGNYPSVVAYYQERLVFANSTNAPDTVWCSRTGHYHNFNTSFIIQDDDAVTFRLISDEVDAIRHILNLGRMVLLTEGAEWLVEGDANGVLTPSAVNPRLGSTNGVSSVRPIKADNRLLFVQALGSAVRDLKSDVQFGYYSLVGNDVTIYSTHLVDGFGITDWAWQQIPPHVVWAVRSDGIILGLTYIPEQEMLAWHRHDTLGFFESACVVPEGRAHVLYVIAKRLINGAYHRYIERMTTSNVLPVFATPEDAAGAPGGVITPPPPPPPPPPSPTSINPPTNASTTDVGTSGATANWVAGNLIAPSRVQIRLQGGDDASWVSTDISGGFTSIAFTGLLSGTAYEWRVAHVIGTTVSAWLGPIAPTQFTTVSATEGLDPPASAPVIFDSQHPSGETVIHISWPAATVVGSFSTLQIAGPTDLTPTDGEFSTISGFAVGVGTAVWTLTVHGTYWLRVRYEKTGFTPSEWAGPSEWVITITDET